MKSLSSVLNFVGRDSSLSLQFTKFQNIFDQHKPSSAVLNEIIVFIPLNGASIMLPFTSSADTHTYLSETQRQTHFTPVTSELFLGEARRWGEGGWWISSVI